MPRDGAIFSEMTVMTISSAAGSWGIRMSTNYLRLSTRALILLLILTSTAFADRMTFDVKGVGGNVVGGYWIAAEGDIVDDSADDLEKYLKENKDFTGI